VRSRGPCRPSRPAACRTFSTSSGVRYSLERRSAFSCRRGGRAEPRVDRDLGAEDLVVRWRDGTFPFSSIGERLDATIFPGEFLEDFAIRAFYTFP
jgi:hypothetical protein